MIGSSVLLAFSFSAALYGQTTPLIVNSPNSPVRIISVTSRPNDLISSMTVRSESTKTVKSIRIAVLVAVPRGCGQNTFQSQDHEADRVIELLPKSTTSIAEVGMSPKAVKKIERDHKAVAVVSQVTISSAEFDDGSMWTMKRAGQTIDDEMIAKTAEASCF